MKQSKAKLLAMCLGLFMISMTTARAATDYTTVNGETENHMRVTGNLLPEESEPTEETKEKELKPEKQIDPPKTSNQKDDYLPKTGENQSKVPFTLGMLLVLGTTVIIVRKLNKKTS